MLDRYSGKWLSLKKVNATITSGIDNIIKFFIGYFHRSLYLRRSR